MASSLPKELQELQELQMVGTWTLQPYKNHELERLPNFSKFSWGKLLPDVASLVGIEL